MNRGTYHGLDYLRLMAMTTVAVQHAMAVYGAYSLTTWNQINLGQSGVAVFCAISGFLAFYSSSTRDRTPESWLKRRLMGIFPAYWLTTLVAFAMVLAVGSQPLSLGLFVSQMLGTGYFTHGWDLVNVVSWFISLILLCYLLAWAAKRLDRGGVSLIAFALLALLLVVNRVEVDLSRHVLTFCLAGWMAHVWRGRILLMAAAGLALITAGGWDHQLVYSGIGLLLLGGGLALPISSPPWVRTSAARTYEFFLVHGIFLVAAAKLISDAPFLGSFLALVAACLGAIMLHLIVRIPERLPTLYFLRS